jgi:hypothetical protein
MSLGTVWGSLRSARPTCLFAAPTNLFDVTRALVVPAASWFRKISPTSRKSSVFSVAYESAKRNFIRS